MSILKDKQGIQPELRDVFKDFDVKSPIDLPMPAEADLDGAADLPTTVGKVNAILAKLRTAGLLGV